MIADGPCSYVDPLWDLRLFSLATEIVAMPAKSDRRAAIEVYGKSEGEAAQRRLEKLVQCVWTRCSRVQSGATRR